MGCRYRALFTLVWLAVTATDGQAQSGSLQACDPGREVNTPNDLRVIRSCRETDAYSTTTLTDPTGRVSMLVYGLAQYRRWYESQKTRDPQLDPSQLILYVDHRPLPRFYGQLPDREHSHLTFDLARLSQQTGGHADSLGAWKLLLTDGIRDRKMDVSVGFPTRGPLPSDVDDFEIRAISTTWLAVWSAFAAVLLSFLIWAGYSSDMLRVPGAQPGATANGAPAPRKAYSLARTQMAAWFFAILVTYLFIYLVTGVLDSITATVLGLMGISAATGFAATVVDVGSLTPGDTAPASKGFVQDLVREGTDMSLPRLQIVVWTIVLLFIFGRAVHATLSMPEFNATLLGLMGISGGTYVGFKPPDKKS